VGGVLVASGALVALTVGVAAAVAVGCAAVAVAGAMVAVGFTSVSERAAAACTRGEAVGAAAAAVGGTMTVAVALPEPHADRSSVAQNGRRMKRGSGRDRGTINLRRMVAAPGGSIPQSRCQWCADHAARAAVVTIRC